MKRFFSYVSILLLIVIAFGYAVNGYKILSLLQKSAQNPLYVATNWTVQSVDSSISDAIKFQKGDSLTRVNQNRTNNFISLDNELVANHGKKVEIEVLRNGKSVVLAGTVPSDLQVNDFESRILFKPTYLGDPNNAVITPHVKNRLVTGVIILTGMMILFFGDAVLLFKKQQVGWYFGIALVLVGTAGVISGGGDLSKILMRAWLFVLLAISLFLSYTKVRKEP